MAFKIFFYVAEKIRTKLYSFADVEVAGYPLENIDTIAVDGHIDRLSALHLAAYGDTENHLKLLDGFMIHLLLSKWHNFVKYRSMILFQHYMFIDYFFNVLIFYRFYFELILFVVFYIFSSLAVFLKVQYFKLLVEKTNCTVQVFLNHTLAVKCNNCTVSYKATFFDDSCVDCLYGTDFGIDPFFSVRTVIEMIVCLYSAIFIAKIAYEVYNQHLKLYIFNLYANQTKFMFILSNICVLIALGARLLCNETVEDYCTVLAILLMTFYFLYFGRYRLNFFNPLLEHI